jgi:hypothetical protein
VTAATMRQKMAARNGNTSKNLINRGLRPQEMSCATF